jgi:hypothetical protein
MWSGAPEVSARPGHPRVAAQDSDARPGPRTTDSQWAVLDPAFGSGGKVTTGISGGDDQAFALALQPDGKLVAAGFAAGPGGFDRALARYRAH